MPSPARWLLAPLHALAVASSAKSFKDNPVIGSAALNRRGLHIGRKRVAARAAERRRRSLAPLLSAADHEAFHRDGYVVKPDFLDPATFAALRAEVLGLDAEAREFVDGYSLTRLILLDAPTLARVPTTRAVLEGPGYRNLHAYVGSFLRRPHLFVQTVFSHAREGVPDVQSHFHSDTFHPTVKSWLFLTETEADTAAFTYVPGSHRDNQRRLAWERRVSVTAGQGRDRLTAEGSLRISEAELKRLGYPEPRKLAVASNTLVVADTSGFHRRGLSERPATRVSIWAYSRSNPFLPWAGGDLLGIGGLRGRAVRALWAAQDLASRVLGASNGWRWVGRRRPMDPPS